MIANFSSYLIKNDILPHDKIEKLLQYQVIKGGTLDTLIYELKYLDLPEIFHHLKKSFQGDDHFFDLATFEINQDLIHKVSREVIVNYHALPIDMDLEKIYLLVKSNLTKNTLDYIKKRYGLNVAYHVIPEIFFEYLLKMLAFKKSSSRFETFFETDFSPLFSFRILSKPVPDILLEGKIQELREKQDAIIARSKASEEALQKSQIDLPSPQKKEQSRPQSDIIRPAHTAEKQSITAESGRFHPVVQQTEWDELIFKNALKILSNKDYILDTTLSFFLTKFTFALFMGKGKNYIKLVKYLLNDREATPDKQIELNAIIPLLNQLFQDHKPFYLITSNEIPELTEMVQTLSANRCSTENLLLFPAYVKERWIGFFVFAKDQLTIEDTIFFKSYSSFVSDALETFVLSQKQKGPKPLEQLNQVIKTEEEVFNLVTSEQSPEPLPEQKPVHFKKFTPDQPAPERVIFDEEISLKDFPISDPPEGGQGILKPSPEENEEIELNLVTPTIDEINDIAQSSEPVIEQSIIAEPEIKSEPVINTEPEAKSNEPVTEPEATNEPVTEPEATPETIDVDIETAVVSPVEDDGFEVEVDLDESNLEEEEAENPFEFEIDFEPPKPTIEIYLPEDEVEVKGNAKIEEMDQEALKQQTISRFIDIITCSNRNDIDKNIKKHEISIEDELLQNKIASIFPGQFWVHQTDLYNLVIPVEQHAPLLHYIIEKKFSDHSFIINLFDDDDMNKRFYSIYLFTRLKSEKAIAPLIKKITYPDKRVSLAAIKALENHKLFQDYKQIRFKFESALHSKMKSIVIDWLAAIKLLRSEFFVPILIDGLVLYKSGDKAIQRNIRQVLIEITKREEKSPKSWNEWWEKNQYRKRKDWILDGLVSKEKHIRLSSFYEAKKIFKNLFGYQPDLPKKELLEIQRKIAEVEQLSQF